MKKQFEQIVGIGMLVFAIGFNLWLYRLEPTATIDPNDNSFQFALVDRTDQVWSFAVKKCSKNILTFPVCFSSYLVDHWVPNWAEGYNLPFYYSHIPQIAIVASYRFLQFFTFHFSLFTYYHWIIYLLLSLFPLSVFLALRVIKLPWLAAGIGALLASHISTDGLYGLDPPSFLWRGYGLSSQLFAMIWMPLALAYSYHFFTTHEEGEVKQFLRELAVRLRIFREKPSQAKRHLTRNENNLYDLGEDSRVSRKNSFADSFMSAVLFLTATAMGHLGLGIIAILSLIPLALSKPLVMILQSARFSDVYEVTKNELTKLLLLAGIVIFFLSYWIIPIVLADNYHNISFWDPPWKFASYGARETITRLLNGDLFDWGRGPWMTVLVLVGLIGAVLSGSVYLPFALLFTFWLLMYFGRTTWGGLIDLIPGMKEFHLSRFIVGVHAAGLFLAPIGLSWLCTELWSRVPQRFLISIKIITVLTMITIIGIPIYKQSIEYAKHNDRLIKQANENHAKVSDDEEALFTTLRRYEATNPGRVFAGRGGGFGKDFRVVETPYYMNLSTYGIPTVLWLPETWSPNSDVEQYFSEDKAKDYDLFGIHYVAAPPSQKPEAFWKLIAQRPTWKLYEVSPTDEAANYFTTGVRPAVVATDKRSYGNVIRLWIQSDAHVRGLYPELTFDRNYPKKTGLPNFKMIDESTFMVPDGSRHNIFMEPPVYLPPNVSSIEQFKTLRIDQYDNMKLLGPEEVDSDMVFKTKVEVGENCTECIVVLKQSFHPNWRVTIDGKSADAFTVFPFYLASLVPRGTHEVVFSYEPSGLKILLLVIAWVLFPIFLFVKKYLNLLTNRARNS